MSIQKFISRLLKRVEEEQSVLITDSTIDSVLMKNGSHMSCAELISYMTETKRDSEYHTVYRLPSNIEITNIGVNSDGDTVYKVYKVKVDPRTGLRIN